jgi:hypothetical protein
VALAKPSYQGFDHEVEEKGRQRVTLEGASCDWDGRCTAIRGDKRGGGGGVEVANDGDEVIRQSKGGEDGGELSMIYGRIGSLEVNVGNITVLALAVCRFKG